MSEQSQSNRGRSPFIRIIMVVAVIAVVLLVVGVISFFAALSARNAPLEVEAYPGATLLGQQPVEEGHDWVFYVSDAPVEDVITFYEQRLEACRRRDNAEPQPGDPEFEVRCFADGSLLFTTQSTTVIIQPGVDEYAGRTRISMERRWGQ